MRSAPKVGGGDSPTAETASEAHKRDALLAAICHDLRAPLAAVMMGANFVLQTTPEDEASGRSRRVLQAIVRSCKQMERLVRDFGDLSEIESDAVVLRPGLHEAAQIVEIAGEAARVQAEAKSVTFELIRPKQPALLRCDRDRVLRALAHVIENAIRFAPEGSVVSLRVTDEASSICFAVTDHGAGLSEETRIHLFDRTWHAARADRVGAGLGLAIARGFALAHGGDLDVTMGHEPSTTVSLRIPKALDPTGEPTSTQ